MLFHLRATNRGLVRASIHREISREISGAVRVSKGLIPHEPLGITYRRVPLDLNDI